MNKTILKRANTLSSVANISASEEQLDAAIFYCLNALTKRHSPSEQFRATFIKGMFLKPNTKAFIHVLHYLFNVYDAKEFRKRFYWPIFDKNAESAFRSSTVEYVNSLVERGKLEMERIKAHTVVLPGGAKFMKFLLVLIKFVLKEELRRAGGGTGGKIVAKRDVERLIEYHQEWEHIGLKMREIVQKDLVLIQSRILEIDEWIEELFRNCQGPARQMSFEKLMQLWGTFNRKYFEENEARRQRLKDVTEEYNKVLVVAKRKLEPKELSLGINEDELKETLYRLEVLFPDNACHFREVFDENNKIDAVKLFEIITFLLPDIGQHFANFSVRSTESLKFELKELSKVAVKSDSICHELASLRRGLPFIDAKFQELTGQDEIQELNNDLGIRNKIFSTPPITLNFQEDAEGGTRPISKRNRIALLDDDHVHQMNLRMRLLSSSVCQQLPKTPRSARKPKAAMPSPGNVFAFPKPARKEKMNPLSMLNKITAQGKAKSKPAHPVNSTMNLSSISTLGEISLRPEFSSTLLGTPEKQSSHNRRSMNANETLITETVPDPPAQQQITLAVNSPACQPSPRFKTIYNGDVIHQTTTTKAAMSPNSLFLLSQTSKTTRRRSSLLQLDQLQISPSGKLDPLVKTPKTGYRTSIGGTIGEFGELPRIRISTMGEMDSGICEDNRIMEDVPVEDSFVADDMERTLSHEENSPPLDLSNTLVDFGLSKLSLTCHADNNAEPEPEPADVPMETNDEDLFNVSDGILTDFD